MSAALSATAFAPTGYPHNKLDINAKSQSILNKNSVSEYLNFECDFKVRVVITIKGNNAGKTLYAQIVIPSKKLRIYFAGAEINTATIQIG